MQKNAAKECSNQNENKFVNNLSPSRDGICHQSQLVRQTTPKPYVRVKKSASKLEKDYALSSCTNVAIDR